jgi:hypothetical protein
LYNCYELFVDELTDRNLQYLTHVLGLAEDMPERELSERISKAMYEDVYIRTLMEDDLMAAIRKMLAEEQQEIKVVEAKKPMPEEIKKLLSHREEIKLTICARDDAHICRERIERRLACLYKCIKCSDMVLWMEKKLEDDIAKEISVIVEGARLPEIMKLIGNYVSEVFECEEVADVLRVYV